MSRLDEAFLSEGVCSQSQPEQLAIVATLFGLTPTLPSRSRVLELGCAAGGNLIPLASRYPNAAFLGIDSRPDYVDAGRQTINALGLKNIKLYHADFTALRPSKQKFDYIICRDRYSRVPQSAQNSVLNVIRDNLAERGVAFVSYHTYPGWKQREIVRDAMSFQLGTSDQHGQDIHRAREVFALLQTATVPSSSFGKMLHDEATRVTGTPAATFYREYFDETIRPCYFREFIGRAQENRLGFLGEASITDLAPSRMSGAVAEALKKLSRGNILETQQYLDFFRNRTFRQTLLIHREAMKRVKRTISPTSLQPFLFSCALAPTNRAALANEEATEFCDPIGRTVEVMIPAVKSMLLVFSEAYPFPLTFDALLIGIRKHLGLDIGAAQTEFHKIGDVLLSFTLEGAVRLHLEPTASTDLDPRQPMAFSPARYLALKKRLTVPNQHHENIALSEIDARILALLDGKTQKDELIRILVALTVRGELTLMRDNIRLSESEEIFPVVEKLLAESLKKFRWLALLVD